MTKKIIDIYPPEPKSSDSVSENKEQSSKPSIPVKNKKKRKIPAVFAGFVLILIVFSIAIVFLTTQASMALEIQPVKEILRLEESFEARVSQEEIDFEKKIIPGRFFEKEIQIKEQFKSTGVLEKSGRAEGMIKVYNTHTPITPVTLRAQTRFLSSEGSKIFKAPAKIYIPSARIENGKVIPGSVEIKVIAQEAGENYNIGPSNFSIPGLSGNALYYSIYAESESLITGGFKEEVSVVTEKDIENAKDLFVEKAFEEAKVSLKNEVSEFFVLLDDSIIKLEEIDCPEVLDMEINSFFCEGYVKINGLGFKKLDIEELSKFSANLLLSPTQVLIEETLELKYLRPEVIMEKGKLFASLDIGFETYKDVLVEVLRDEIRGKSREEIESFIYDNYPQVNGLNMKFSPFWVSKAPKDSQKIDIEMIPLYGLLE